MTWSDRITALIMLAFWLGLCLVGIRIYTKRIDRKRREFVSKRTMMRYRNFDEDYPDDWK
jgi:hypothetical protein